MAVQAQLLKKRERESSLISIIFHSDDIYQISCVWQVQLSCAPLPSHKCPLWWAGRMSQQAVTLGEKEELDKGGRGRRTERCTKNYKKKKRPKKEKTQTNHPKPTKSGKWERKRKRQKKKLVEIVWKAFYAPTLQSAVFKISWKKKKRSGVFTVVSVNVLVTQLILYCTVLRLLHFLLYYFPSITVFSVCLEEVFVFFFNPFLPQSWV